MIRRFIFVPSAVKGSAKGAAPFTTSVCALAPKRPVRAAKRVPATTKVHAAPSAKAKRQESPKQTHEATLQAEEQQYKHWFRHTYGVGDRRDDSSALPTASATLRYAANLASGGALGHSMDIQRCPSTDVLAIVAGEGYASDEASAPAGAPFPSANTCTRRASRVAEDDKSSALLSARRIHNADHAHWFKHTYCLPDWEVLVSSLVVNDNANAVTNTSVAPIAPVAPSCRPVTTCANRCDLPYSARSSLEISMLMQRLQSVADPQMMTARSLFNL